MRILATIWMVCLLWIAAGGCQRPLTPVALTGGQSDGTVAQAQAELDPKIRARVQAVNAELSELVDHP